LKGIDADLVQVDRSLIGR